MGQSLADLVDALRLGPEHDAALVRGEAVPGDRHDVDVRVADDVALREDTAGLVHDRVHHHLDDLLVGDLDRRLALASLLEERGKPLGVGHSPAPLVHVVADTRLLPEPLGLHQVPPHGRDVTPVAVGLRDDARRVHADVHAGEVHHLVHAHRHVHERLEHAVDAVRAHAVLDEEGRGLAVGEEDAVRGESHAVADGHGRLAEALRVADRVRHHLLRGGGSADDLEERHHVCGREEVEADDAVSSVGLFSDDVDVDGRGVGG
mmetsp:Transcript_23536/g.45969  ORF Transcript_23536/g.45969 Transcript_23536/m.45969 type:complete len:262 (-) Transcript_23536:280-1065(-)